MFTLLSNFDEFSRELKKNPSGFNWDYWTDAIFVSLWQPSPLIEKRFKGGIALWGLWVLFQIGSRIGKQSNRGNYEGANTTLGFRLLPTEAHLETLVPILADITVEETTMYNIGIEGANDQTHVIQSCLFDNFTILGFRKSLSAFLLTIMKVRRLHRSLYPLLENVNWQLPSGFIPRTAELILREGLELEVLRQIPCPHETLLLTYELIPESKAWVLWARESGKRVIHIMHGQRLPTYQVTMATDLVLFSKLDESWFRKRVPENVKIWTIGHPRLESIRSEIGAPRQHAPTKKPRITYFSQPAEGDYSQELRKNDWGIIRGLQGKAEVRFHLHPRESRVKAIEDLTSLGIDFVLISDAGLHEDLRWSDAVVSSWSTVSMEAAACGRGIFWACSTPEKYEASQELRDAGVGALIQSPQEWDEHLQAWHNTGWNSPTLVSEQMLKELGMIGDMEKPFLERLGIDS